MAELLLKLVSKSYFVVIETHWLLSCFLTHILVDVLCCGIALELLDQEFHCTASKSSCKFELLLIFCLRGGASHANYCICAVELCR